MVPAQLPADVAGFAGRAEHLALLDALLADAPTQAPTAVVISAVSGTAGIGKTALAVHWGHRVREKFPDGQLYVNLRGFDPGGRVMEPGEAIRGFLDAYGVPPQRIPPNLDAQAALYRSLLTDKRVLVVLDNAREPLPLWRFQDLRYRRSSTGPNGFRAVPSAGDMPGGMPAGHGGEQVGRHRSSVATPSEAGRACWIAENAVWADGREAASPQRAHQLTEGTGVARRTIRPHRLWVQRQHQPHARSDVRSVSGGTGMVRGSGAPPGSRYVDQRRYVVAASLSDLNGPVSGVVTLDRRLDWSGDSSYDLDDAGDLQLMYQTVLNQATTVDDLCRWLDGDTLRRLWPSLWLPARLRELWQTRFPELTTPPRAMAG